VSSRAGARAFVPVSDVTLLAAVDRADRHGSGEGAVWVDVVEHLGFLPGPRVTVSLRPQLQRLIEQGAVERSRKPKDQFVRLTATGRRRLARARRQGKQLDLAEAPQHRQWREANERASREITALRKQMRETLAQARRLLDSRTTDAMSWALSSTRLRRDSARVAWAIYCLHEWEEPNDTELDESANDRLRTLDLGRTDLADA